MTRIRVVLPGHLQNLAGVDREVQVDVGADHPSISDVLDALEARHPTLRGTIRDHGTGERRSYLRYFVCERDISHDSPDLPLPEPVVRGDEVVRVLGAISGGEG